MMFKQAHNSIVGAAAAVLVGLSAGTAHGQKVGTVFYIALENHNFTQNPTVQAGAPLQLYGNPAAPFLNSLVTPNNPNSVQTSYATNYTNAGLSVHPSEPNYVWAEAGTDFGVHTDNDPSIASNNIFTAPHLTAQMNAAGITWKNYQEDVQYSTGPTHSTSGTGGTAPSGLAVGNNPYFGTAQYNYGVKHTPMAFFSDTATQNAAPLGQLATDLTNNTVGQYNWITPDQFNDMHSSLSTDFNYASQTWTHGTDQEAVAIGDHFLSVLIPLIEASQAYQNNGAIVIWNDETEPSNGTGDGPGNTSTEIVISPLAKGNAFASNVPLNHSSDIRSVEEIFGLGTLNNPIPAAETSSTVGYANVPFQNDLSPLFQSGAVPEPASLGLIGVGAVALLGRRRRTN